MIKFKKSICVAHPNYETGFAEDGTLKVRAALFASFCMLASLPANAEQLNVSLIGGGYGRSVFFEFGQRFEAETGIDIIWTVKHDADYKQGLDDWFKGTDTPDVIQWQGGERLFQYVREGWVEPITDFWIDNGLDASFTPAIQSTVAFEQDVYGVPYSFYHWGFYYKDSLFQSLGIEPPRDWESLLSMCTTMRAAGLEPIVIGTRYNWPAAAWFDYLDLRINGSDFHLALTRGEISYTDDKVRAVFEHWKELLDAECFIEAATHRNMNWSDPLPYLYRDMAGTGLFGNFVTGEIAPRYQSDFRFFPFPKINEVPRAEEAPTDIFVIPAQSENKENARQFLAFMARADIQEEMNGRLKTIPTNKFAAISSDRFIAEGSDLLQSADGVAQFFDRDTPKPMADRATVLFSKFMETGDIDQTLIALENARHHAYQTETAAAETSKKSQAE